MWWNRTNVWLFWEHEYFVMGKKIKNIFLNAFLQRRHKPISQCFNRRFLITAVLRRMRGKSPFRRIKHMLSNRADAGRQQTGKSVRPPVVLRVLSSTVVVNGRAFPTTYGAGESSRCAHKIPNHQSICSSTRRRWRLATERKTRSERARRGNSFLLRFSRSDIPIVRVRVCVISSRVPCAVCKVRFRVCD